jgi:fibro-slime domain-containing protein
MGACVASLLAAACGGGGTQSTFGPSGAGGANASTTTMGSTTTVGSPGAGGSIIANIPDGGFAGGSADGGRIIGTLPPGFTKTEAGGYKLGDPIMGAGLMDTGLGGACNEIVGVVRDFKGYNVQGGHPDFEHFMGSGTLGMVETALGADLKPVYTGVCEATSPPITACPSGQMTTGKTNFDQWYRFTDGVNKPYLVYFFFQPTPGQAVITFNSQFFFPLDNAGWQTPGIAGGDTAQGGNDGKPHNFAFTTEVHTKFKYTGGETFTFEGDDDLWVFMNKQLAIDLGGLHSALIRTVNLDAQAGALGLVKGNTYPLDLFHAERHTTASHFRIDTTLSLVDCGSIPPDVPR